MIHKLTVVDSNLKEDIIDYDSIKNEFSSQNLIYTSDSVNSEFIPSLYFHIPDVIATTNIVATVDKALKEVKHKPRKVVFFGTDPLKDVGLLKKIIEEFYKVDKKFRFYLNTSGALLAEKEVRKFLIDNKIRVNFLFQGLGDLLQTKGFRLAILELVIELYPYFIFVQNKVSPIREDVDFLINTIKSTNFLFTSFLGHSKTQIEYDPTLYESLLLEDDLSGIWITPNKLISRFMERLNTCNFNGDCLAISDAVTIDIKGNRLQCTEYEDSALINMRMKDWVDRCEGCIVKALCVGPCPNNPEIKYGSDYCNSQKSRLLPIFGQAVTSLTGKTLIRVVE